jgi:hypothetical protein
MALAASVDSLESVPETFQSLYIEQNGKYTLDVEGGIPDVSNLKTAIDTERKRLSEAEKAKKNLESKLASYEGIDVNKYKELLTKAERDEEERLIAEGKKDEVFNAKLESVNNEWKKQILDKESLIESSNKRIEQLRSKALSDQIRSGINGVFHAHANDDAVMVAMNLFKLDDNDNVVMVDSNGSIVLGNNALSIREWANSSELKETKPHWYPAPLGGTGGQQTGSKGGSKTMSRTDFMALSAPEQARIMKEKTIKIVDK